MDSSLKINQQEKDRVREKAEELGIEALTQKEKAIHRELFWENTGGKVERFTEKEVFSLKGKNHVWELEDAKTRRVACTSCLVRHGHILHPAHEWNLKDGKLYHLEKGKWKEWIY